MDVFSHSTPRIPTRGWRHLFSALALIAICTASTFAQSPARLIRPGDFSTGLKGWWKMDEASGIRLDSSGTGNHLTSNNNVGSAVEDYWATGERSADFERDSSQYYSIANGTQTGLNLNGSYSVSMWVKLESMVVNNLLFGKWQSNQGYYAVIGTGGRVDWVHDLTYLVPSSSNAVLTTGKWYHLSFVYDTTANTASLYVDGNLDKTASITQDASINGLDFRLGLLNVEYFDGMMKDVAVWDRPLTSVEVKSLASGIDVSTAYRPGNVTVAPTAWWKLNELSGGSGAVSRADSAGTHTLTDNNTVQTDGGYLDGASADLVRANSEYFTAADSADWTIGSGDASVGTWVRFENMAAGMDYPLFCHNENGSNYWVLNVAYMSGRHWLRLVHAVGNTLTIDLQADWQPAAGVWYHVTWTKQGTQHRFYVDGKQIGAPQTSAVAMNDYSGQVVIGRISDVGLYFNGRLADMAFWKGYALSAAEIKALAMALPVQKAGIVSYWPLDEASGTRSDVIGTNHLSPVNTPASAAGIVGTAGQFTRTSSQYLSILDAAQSGLDLTSQWSVFTWVNPASTVANMFPLSKNAAAGAGGPGYAINQRSDRLHGVHVEDTTSVGTTLVTVGAWNMIGGSFDVAAGKRSYFNGGLDGVNVSPYAPINTTLPFLIGAENPSSGHYDGLIDEVIVARRVFRDEEVKALYLRGMGGIPAMSFLAAQEASGVAITADGGGSVGFSSQAVETSSAAKTITIWNTSDQTLTNLAVTLTGAEAASFVLNTTGTATVLAAGSSTTFTVTFAPQVVGTRTATVQISSSSSVAANPFDIALSGTGTADVPVITSLSSHNAKPGDSVTITGSGFSAVPGNNAVWFGAAKGTVTAASTTQLTVTVPVGATAGLVSVSVHGLTAFSRRVFTPSYTGAGLTLAGMEFYESGRFATGTEPLGNFIADVDVDGQPDILSANGNGNSLSVLRNTTVGVGAAPAFAAKVDFSAGGRHEGVVAQDVSGDGKLDLITSGESNGNINILRNDSAAGAISAGSFTALTALTGGGVPQRPLSCDLDGDGMPDLIAALANSGNVAVHRQTSSGVFGARQLVSTGGTDARRVVVSDFDGDGKPDIAISHEAPAKIALLRNTSTPGSISFSLATDLATAGECYAIDTGDFDGDGRDDLVIGHYYTATLRLWRNTGSPGTVSFDPSFDLITEGGNYDICVGDINGDGKPDIAAAHGSGGKVTLIPNTHVSGALSSGSFGTRTFLNPGGIPHHVSIGDLNGDHTPEILVTMYGTNELAVWRSAILPVPVLGTLSATSGPAGASMVITGSNFSSTPSDNVVWFGAVKGTVTAATATQLTVSVPAGASYDRIRVTANGRTGWSAQPFVPTFDGDPGLSAASFATPLSITGVNEPSGITSADIDGDGKPDLIVASYQEKRMRVFRNLLSTGQANTVTPFTAGAFASAADFTAPLSTDNVAVGDLNGDGKPDVVVNDYNTGSAYGTSVSVYINTSTPGSVSFNAYFQLACASTPEGICIADLNADGRAEVLVAESGYPGSGNTISVFKNQYTAGTMTSASFQRFSLSTGAGGQMPRQIAVGDLDGDALPEIVVTNWDANAVAIIGNHSTVENLGAGTFDAAVPYSTAAAPYDVALADFDRDGDLDIAAACYSGSSVTSLKNSGSGSLSTRFTTNQTSTTATNANFLDVGDLDGDSYPDLVVSTAAGQAVSVLRNQPSIPAGSGWQFGPKIDFATSVNVGGVSIADYDLDGRPDIASSSLTGGLIKVHRNIVPPFVPVPTITNLSATSGIPGSSLTITGTNFSTAPADNIVWFGAVKGTVTAATSTQLTVTIPAGATHDRIRVSVSGRTGYSAQPFLPTFAGDPGVSASSLAVPLSMSTEGATSSTISGDIDGDGKPDIVTTDYTGNRMSVLRNLLAAGGSGTTTAFSAGAFAAPVHFTITQSPHSVALGDLNNDGKLDAVVGGYTASSVFVFINTSAAGAVSFSPNFELTCGSTPLGMAVADLNGDGRAEILVADTGSGSGNTVSIFANDHGSGPLSAVHFTRFNLSTGSGSKTPKYIAVGDLDGDAKPEIVVTNNTANEVAIFGNHSDANDISATAFDSVITYATSTTPSAVALADHDRDGDLDILTGDYGSDRLTVLRNTGSGSLGTRFLSNQIGVATAGSPYAMDVGDMDGDGYPDAAVGCVGNTLSVLRTQPAGGGWSFGPRQDFSLPNFGNGGCTVADFDRDGRPDVVVGSYQGGAVYVFRNIVPPFVPVPTITGLSTTSTKPGKSITITGTNFSTTPANNVVWFGSVRGTVTAATSTELTITVPHGAILGPVSVRVGSRSAQSAQAFRPQFQGQGNLTAGSFATTRAIDGPGGANGSAVSDFDGDGKPDVAVGSYTGHYVSVYLNALTPGSLAAGADFPANVLTAPSATLSANPYVQRVAVGDLDGDGKMDLITAHNTVSYVSVLRNTSTVGNVSFEAQDTFSVGGTPLGIEIADLNQDGRPEIAVATSAGVSVLRNTSSLGVIDTSSFAANVDLNMGGGCRDVALRDINGDGKADILATQLGGTLAVKENLSLPYDVLVAGSFGSTASFTTASGTDAMAVVDLDLDGHADVLTENNSAPSVSVFRNTAAGSIASRLTKVTDKNSVGGSGDGIGTGDLNGDGKPDAVRSPGGSSFWEIFQNNSSLGTIALVDALNIDTASTTYGGHVVDMDADGRPDIVGHSYDSSKVLLTRNIHAFGTPQIAVEQPVSTPLTDGSGVLSLGNITVGQNSSVMTVTIRNTGTADLENLALSLSGAQMAEFTLGTLPTTVLAPGGSTTFTVTFSPAGLGTRSAALQIASNVSGATNPFDLTLTGSGINGTLTTNFTSGSQTGLTTNGFTASGSTASLTLGHAPAPGSVLNLVNNTSANPISGVFSNLAQAQTVTLSFGGNDYRYFADYFGGDGNDLMLVLQGPGVLDYSFGGTGRVRTAIGTGNDQARAVAVQADGKVVAAGHDGADFVLVRYNVDGSLDSTFGTGGKVVTPVGTETDEAHGVVVQPDGKIVVAGFAQTTGVRSFALLRYNSNGTLDTTFDSDGKVVTPVGAGSEGRDVVLQSDGKIVVGGDHWSGTDTDFALARYNTNGSLDTSFGTGGIVTTVQAGKHDEAACVAVAPDGKIVLGGHYQQGTDHVIELARYLANGTLDTTFSGDGIVITQIGAAEMAHDVVVQPDGKIVMVGQAPGGGGNDARIIRYQMNGDLDETFSEDGHAGVAMGSYGDYAHSVVLQWDGKILVAGITEDGMGANMMLARFLTDGAFDTSFNGTGMVSTSLGATSSDFAYGMALAPDGRIVLAGLTTVDGTWDFVAARYLVETEWPATFATAADVPFNLGALNATGLSINITLGFQPTAGTVLTLVNNTGAAAITGAFTNLANGAVVPLSFGGITYNFLASYTGGTGNDLTLTTLGGALDPTFNVTGKRLAAVSSTENDFANDVAIQPDGKIVSVGFTTSGNLRDFLVLRHNADGTPDASFGTGGVVTTSMVSGNDTAAAVAIQGDGKIVVVGQADLGGNNTEFALARYNTNGTLDTTFDGDGKLVIALASEQNLSDVVIQPDGKIVAAGFSKTSVEDMTLLRLNSNGSLDTTFDGDGMVSTSFGHSSVALSVFVMADGRILAGGGMSGANLLMARYQSNGALDTTFDTDGKVSVTLGGSDDFIRELAVDSAGRIVVSGESFNGSKRNVLVGRFTSSGALDTTFGGTGLITQSVTSGDDIGWAMSLQLDGKIVIGGVANYASGDFLLLRYLASGTLDTGFGAGGILTAPIGSADDRGIGLAIQNDGKIVLVGASFDGNDYDAALARFQVESSYTAAFASAADVPLMAPSVTATGRTVTVTLGFDPTPGTVLTLLNNTGTQPISGTFTGLANGQLVPLTYGGITYNFLASYTGGTGNDLTLTALAGTLDGGFGTTGKVVTTFGSNNDSIYAVATQQDGKIVAVGASGSFPETDMVLARYHPDGMLDTSFNGTGKITLALAQNDELHAVAVQNDGKIVAAGHSGSTSVYSVVVLRYNVDGTPDTGFNGNGRVTTAVGATGNYANGIIIQPDGRILVTGATQDGGGFFDFSLIRYLANGALDTSLNSTGKLTTSFGTHDSASSVTLQPDGKIVVAGYAWTGSEYDFAVVRYQSSGVLDTTFDGDGKVTTAIGGARDSAFGVVVQPDGRIVVGGFSSNGTDDDAAIVRYNTDGTLDTSFNGNGKLTVAIGTGDDGARSISLQSDGKILAGGYATNSGNADFALLRILTNGSLDTSFGNGGKITTAIGSGSDKAFAMAVQVDGNVILAGSSFNGSNDDFAMARYTVETTSDAVFATETSVPLNTNGFAATGRTVNVTLNFAPSPGTELRLLNNTGTQPITGTFTNLAHGATVPLTFNSVTYNFVANYTGGTGNDLTLLLPGPGALDYTFNGSGKAVTAIGGGDDVARAVAVQTDGKVVAAGKSFNGSNYDFAVARYNPDGTLDPAFGSGGKVTTNFGSTDDEATAVSLQNNGNITVVGRSGTYPNYVFALARYTGAGALDVSFGNGGKVTTALGGGNLGAYAAAAQSDGKIVVTGRNATGSVGPYSCVTVRYNTDGTLDTSFGGTGIVNTDLGGTANGGQGVAVQGDGKILVAGYMDSGSNEDFAIVRYNSNGSLDTSFAGTGKVITPIGISSENGDAVVLQSDGKILVAGYMNASGGDFDFAVVRYNTNGSLDTSYNGTGKVTTSFGSVEDLGYSAALQADGKLVVAGYSKVASSFVFALSRYNTNGTLDSSFGKGGKITTAIGSSDDRAFSLALQSNGKIIVAGESFNGYNYNFALTRYLIETTHAVTFAAVTDVPLSSNGITATGRTLNITLGFTPNPGTSLKVFDNTSLQPISGEFVNLAQGQTVTLNFSGTDYSFVANYFGGDGNDLTLEWANTKLAAFGANESGQLGITGMAAQANVPTQVVATAAIYQKTILSMSAGQAHSLAACADGTVAAWGSNANGQLGNGTTTSAATPVAVTMGGVLSGKKVIAVAAGGQHSLALCNDGTLAAWGDGSFGQIGDGGVLDRNVPVLVNTAGALSGKRVIAISAGANHSAALCSDGTVVCWGGNTNGELGNCSNTQSNVPVAVTTSGVLLGRTAVAVACGQNHTLALLADGAVAAWGLDASGQLGNSSTAASNVPVLVSAAGLLNGKRVVEIAAGGSSSLARCSDGVLASWGLNDSGQLGVNSATTSFTNPQAVHVSGVLSGKTVTRLFAGEKHAGALCGDGTLVTWGEGTGGELGNNTVLDSLQPVLADTTNLGGTDVFVQTSSGASAGHSLALTGTAANESMIVVESPVGTTLNDSTSNQIVFGTTLPGTVKTRMVTIRNTGTQTLSSLGVAITGTAPNIANFSIQTPLAVSLAPGDATSFTLTFAPSTIGSKTVVLEISSNVAGTLNPFQIGVQGTVLNTLAASYTNGQEVPASASSFSAAAKSVNFSLNYAPPTGTTLTVVENTGAAFISGAFSNLTHGQGVTLTHNSINYEFVANYHGGDGNDLVLHWKGTRLLAWGGNSEGTLGNNSSTGSLTPVAVSSAGVLNGKTILSVAAGERHSLAVCSDGALAAWGANNAGQLGDGTTSPSLAPVLVSTAGVLNGKKVIAAAAGYDFSIALCSDGTLVTFGMNSGGQLGNNSTTPSNVPVLISSTGALSGKSVVSIAAGYDFGLVSCADGTVAAWGQNAYGQFGNNSINNSLVPMAANAGGVLAGKTVRGVAAGFFHSIAICTDGTLAGWGDNSFGELGNGTNDSSLVPVLVTASGALAGRTPVQIAASMLHSAARCTDGTLVTWGDNSFGQLGVAGIESSFVPVVAAAGGVMGGRMAGFLGGGQMHHVIAVTDGYPAAWGENSSGQLGNGVTSASFLPVAVSTAALGAGERVVRVAAGGTGLHSIGIVAVPLASGGAPVVSTNAAESINKTSSTLKGLVNASGTATTAWFEYGLTTSYGSVIPLVPQSVGSGSTSQIFTQGLAGLVPNTTYHFRIVASNTNGAVTGDDFTFTTLPDPPFATTGSVNVNNITNTTAILPGTVNPNNRETTIYFEFGLTDQYGNTTAPQNIATGSSNVNVTAPVSGLTLGTTYHFRLVAQNAAGTAYGDDGVFTTTSFFAPSVGSVSASGQTISSVNVEGVVNPNGLNTSAYFEYGLTTGYGSVTGNLAAGTGTNPTTVSTTIAGLQPATTYHFRLAAFNNLGTTRGSDATFTTLPLPPVVETHAAAALSTTGARLNGKVNAQNGSAVVTFEWGTDGVSFPNSLTATPSPVTGSALTDVSVDLANLAQFTTYHFRVKAVSAGGTTTGSVLTFQPAIISGLTQQFPGAPPASSGTLTVSMLSSTGAPAWRLWGEKQWRASGSSATGLTTGDRNVEFLPIAGMASPAAPPVPVTAGGPPALLEREYFSTPVAGSGGFTVRLRPESITTGLDRAQWRLVGESDAQWRDDDTSLSALPAGSYLIECKSVPGRDTPGVTTHEVVAGSSPTITLWYPAASTQTGTPPSPLLLADLSDNTKPYAYVGQIRSDRGLSTGFVVNDRVIATAAHVVFDDVLLATAPGLQWLHRRHAGALDPVPMIPRGYYLRDGYAAQRQTEPVPGVSSLATQNLDVAALYFSVSEFPADGAYGGYLASDLTNNEFLLSSAPKMLVGYPIDGIASAFQGIMHATPAANITFTKTFERVYSSSGIRSSGGNSGGPLFVQHTNGKWYPAAIYLGSSGQAVVRALDSDVIRLFDAAHYTGSTNNLETSGGITQTNVTGSLSVTSDGAIRVFITPAAAVSANARWNLNGATSNGKGSGSSQGGIKHNSVVTINFTTVSGFQAPTTQNVTITGGQTTTITFEYAPSETPQETWRNTYFGTTANTGNAADTFDFDGDGFTNAQEYAAGTNPTLSGDFFKVTDSQRTASTFTASTAGKAGRTYTLERSTNLNSWTAVGSPQGPLASDGAVTLQDGAMPNDAAFYRIVVTGP